MPRPPADEVQPPGGAQLDIGIHPVGISVFNYMNFLQPECLAGTKYGRRVVRLKNVLEYRDKIPCSLLEDLRHPLSPLVGNKAREVLDKPREGPVVKTCRICHSTQIVQESSPLWYGLRMKKPLRVFETLHVQKILQKGDSLAMAESGEEVRLDSRKAIPGDRVRAEVNPRKRAGRFDALRVELLEASPDRRPAACPHFGACGGCRWQTMNYEAQLRAKAELLDAQLAGLGATDHAARTEVLPSPAEFGYRNKMEYTFSAAKWFENPEDNADTDKRALGLFVPGSPSKVVDIVECRLQAEPANGIRNSTREICLRECWAFYNHRRPEPGPALRTLVIRSNSRGQVLLILIHAGDMEREIAALAAELAAKFPEVVSVYRILNDKLNDSYSDLQPLLVHGAAHLDEEVLGLKFQIGPLSFFQTNIRQTPELYSVARQFAGGQPKRLIFDLYAGTGTIASLFADSAQKVVGIEQIEEAVVAARRAAAANGLGNIEFICGDMKDVLTPKFFESTGKPDLVLCDPPRAGMHPAVIESLLSSGVEQIIYISCNPTSFVADVKRLEAAYRIEALVPVDMAPQTPHLELAASLRLRS